MGSWGQANSVCAAVLGREAAAAVAAAGLHPPQPRQLACRPPNNSHRSLGASSSAIRSSKSADSSSNTGAGRFLAFDGLPMAQITQNTAHAALWVRAGLPARVGARRRRHISCRLLCAARAFAEALGQGTSGWDSKCNCAASEGLVWGLKQASGLGSNMSDGTQATRAEASCRSRLHKTCDV